MENIELNVKNLLSTIPEYNPFGEKITFVAAVKTQTAEDINRAVAAGITDIGDNHVQEFRDKYGEITPQAHRHFIGRLQTNKIKYLIGKCDLYHSVDRLELAAELSKRSLNAGVTSNVLLQINIGREQSKSGFDPDNYEQAYAEAAKLPALRIRGLMAMLPLTEDERALICLAQQMRKKYDTLRAYAPEINCLSMGMSGDYRICIEAGSNMIRLGTAIFGNRKQNA